MPGARLKEVEAKGGLKQPLRLFSVGVIWSKVLYKCFCSWFKLRWVKEGAGEPRKMINGCLLDGGVSQCLIEPLRWVGEGESMDREVSPLSPNRVTFVT